MSKPATDPGSATTGLDATPPVFDYAVLGAFLGDDERAIAAVLQTFLTSVGQSMDEVRTALQQQQWAVIADAAHRIKGAAQMSGAPAMAAVALVLERMSRTGDPHATPQLVLQLDGQWETLQHDPHLQATLAQAQGAP